MTRITTISGTNLKGRTFTTELDAVTVICGPNFAGKTTRLDALQLALGGSHPKLGKQNASLFRLSSGSVMAAHVGLSDGKFVERRWTEKKGAVSMERVGFELDLNPVVLDAQAYFGMSERERLGFVFKLSGMDAGQDYGSALAAKVKGIRLEQTTPEIEKMLSGIADEIMQKWSAKGTNGSEWLEGFAVYAADKKKAAAAAAKRMTGTVAGITELRAQMAAPQQDADRARDKAAQDYAQMVNERERVQSKLTEADALAAKRANIEQKLAGLRLSDAEHDGKRKRKTELEKALANAREQVPAAESAVALARSELTAAEAAVETLNVQFQTATAQDTARTEFDAILDPTGENASVLAEDGQFVTFNEQTVAGYVSATDGCRQRVNKCQEDVNKSDATLAARRRELTAAQSALAGLEAKECCPYCEAAQPGWKAIVEQHHRDTIAALQTAVDGEEQAVLRARMERDAAAKELAASIIKDDEHADLSARLSAAKANLALAESEQRRATEGLKLLAKHPAKAVGDELAKARKELESATDRMKAANAALEQAKQADAQTFSKRSELAGVNCQLTDGGDFSEAIARTEGELSALPPPVERTGIEAAKAKCDAAVEQARQRLEQAKQSANALIASRADAAAKLKAAEAAELTIAESKAWEQVRHFVDELQAECVEKAFAPILATANTIAGRVLRSPLAYRAGEIGRMEGRTWVSTATFSGSEEAVMFASLCVALAAQSPLRIAIVDEMDRLTPENKESLMEAVADAVKAGVLDQFIGCDVRDIDYAGLAGVNVIKI